MNNVFQRTFLTNHGRVLAYHAKLPQTTTRKIDQDIGVTERAIQKLFAALKPADILSGKEQAGTTFTLFAPICRCGTR